MKLIERLLAAPLEQALERARTGRPLILRCRRPDTLERLKELAQIEFFMQVVELTAHGEPEATLLAAVRNEGLHHERLVEVATDPALCDTLFLIDCRSMAADAWRSMAGLWAAANRQKLHGPALCLVGLALPAPVGCQALDDGTLVGPAESLLMARRMRPDPSLIAETADQVAIECARGDLDLLDQLLRLPEADRFYPEAWLARQTETTLDQLYWRGREELCPVKLAKAELGLLRQRIWRGQVQILFPWIEVAREKLVTLAGNWLRPGLKDALQEPLDVRDYEWSHIAVAFATAGRSELSNEAKKIRDLRNMLAHGEPVDYATSGRAAAAATRLETEFQR
jgi:hypothetical protein